MPLRASSVDLAISVPHLHIVKERMSVNFIQSMVLSIGSSKQQSSYSEIIDNGTFHSFFFIQKDTPSNLSPVMLLNF